MSCISDPEDEDNRTIVSQSERRTFNEHLEVMKNDKEFGTHMEIIAFASIHNVNVVVHQAGLAPKEWHSIHFDESKFATTRKLHIAFVKLGKHYSGTRQIGDTLIIDGSQAISPGQSLGRNRSLSRPRSSSLSFPISNTSQEADTPGGTSSSEDNRETCEHCGNSSLVWPSTLPK